MNRTLSYQIPAEDNNKTVATFLKEQGFSRHILIDLKKTKNSIIFVRIFSGNPSDS